jgi:hypothetical protein
MTEVHMKKVLIVTISATLSGLAAPAADIIDTNIAEVAPAIVVAPFVRGEVTGGIGIRYWF